ncbi:ABC transporter permease, partial [Staphylococcus haemolyticus]
MNYLVENSGMLLNKTLEHLYISIMALILAMIVAIPLGILLSKKEKLSKVSLTIAGILQTIPTLAILALMIPLFGVGKVTAIIALFIYVLLPILNNTIVGVQNIDRNIVEAGRSMGMT